MKRALDKISRFITDDQKIGAFLFVFIFCSRIVLDLIIHKLFGLGEEWQHQTFSFYKYNYLIILGYMFIYEVCYLYRYHRFHFSKIQWIGILYVIVAIIATYVNLKEQFAYEYFTKLSLGELMMSMIFVFDVGTKLKRESFEKTLSFCSWFYLGLTFFLNTISLIVLFFNLRGGLTLWGRYIEFPPHIDYPESLLGLGPDPYPGFYYNTSITGPCCSLAVFLLVWLFRTKRINKVLFGLLTITNLYCLFISSNRTGTIGLLAFLFFLIIEYVHTHVQDKKKRNTIYTISLICIFAFLGYMMFRKKSIQYIANTLFTDPFAALDYLGSARMRIVASVLEIVKNSPLLGKGWNAGIPITGSDKIYPYAHNFFLGSLAWTGIIGFIILLLFFVLTFKKSVESTNNIPKYSVLLFIILALAIEGQFENGILGDWNHAYTYLFWFITGFLSNRM